jgi:hypothetical protein
MSDIRQHAHGESRRVKHAQLARMQTIRSERYLESFVRPHLGRDTPRGRWHTEVLQLDGTGAATVRIAVDDDPPVYAKAFPFADGPEVYAKLQVFRLTGFGEGRRHQTVEPLSWDPDQKVLLCRAAAGRAVSDLVGGDPAELAAATAEAGSWLGAFHDAEVRVGAPRSLLVTGELTSLAKRLSKTTALRPDYLPLALEMLAALDDLTYTAADGVVTQTHGQFRPIHVFTAPTTTTVIDLDRSAPGDPARDVAEFLHHLRSSTFVATGEMPRADAACRTFLDGYRRVTGGRNLTNLRFHWARYLMHSLTRHVKSGEVASDHPDRDPTYLRYRAEFDRIVDGSAVA